MDKPKFVEFDENGKGIDVSGKALRKQDALEAKGKKSKKASKK